MTDSRRSRLWWWFVVAGVLFLAAWTGWFIIAARHPVADVPLAQKQGARR